MPAGMRRLVHEPLRPAFSREEGSGHGADVPPTNSPTQEHPPFMSHRLRWTTLLILFAVGCTVWRPLPGGGLTHPGSQQLHDVRLSLLDGTILELDDATISRDSVTGIMKGEGDRRFAVARREVAGVEALQPDGAKSFAAGGLTVLSILVALYITVAIAMSYEGD